MLYDAVLSACSFATRKYDLARGSTWKEAGAPPSKDGLAGCTSS